jgi:hypothetical protein
VLIDNLEAMMLSREPMKLQWLSFNEAIEVVDGE